MGLFRLAGALLALLALAQETLPSFELRREGRTITVQQTASDAEGGVFASRTGCRAPGMVLTTVYAPAPRRAETTVNELVIRSSIVLREQPAGDQEQAVLEHFGGTLVFNPETFCPEEITPSSLPEVTLSQGRTTLEGALFRYHNATGIGVMEGPVSLTRQAEGDSPALSASADRLEFNVDTDTTLLSGNIRVESEDRLSEAETLTLDEEAGIAVLRGNPARSRQGGDTVEGQVIVYYLNTNDVVVREGVRATFQLGE